MKILLLLFYCSQNTVMNKSPSDMRVWRESFYMATYRVFLAGTVFYKAYNVPFSLKAERPAGVPRDFLREFDRTRDAADDESSIPC